MHIAELINFLRVHKEDTQRRMIPLISTEENHVGKIIE